MADVFAASHSVAAAGAALICIKQEKNADAAVVFDPAQGPAPVSGASEKSSQDVAQPESVTGDKP
jgi:hypothetical protein